VKLLSYIFPNWEPEKKWSEFVGGAGDESSTASMEGSGVRSANALDQLQVILFVLSLAIVVVVFALIIALICKKLRPKIIKKLSELKTKFIWNGTIRSITVALMNIIIAATVGMIAIRKGDGSITLIA